MDTTSRIIANGSVQEMLDAALESAFHKDFPTVMKLAMAAGIVPPHDLFESVVEKKHFDCAEVLFASDIPDQRSQVVSAISRNPSYDLIKIAIQFKLPQDVLIPMANGEQVKMPQLLARRGFYTALARLIDEKILAYEAAGVTAADMLPMLANTTAKDSFSVMEGFGDELETEATAPALAAWVASASKDAFPISASLTEEHPLMARAVVRSAYAGDSRSALLSAVAAHCNADVIKFALASGVAPDADYSVAGVEGPLKLPQALLQLRAEPLLEALLADETITLPACGVAATDLWPHAHACSDEALPSLAAVAERFGEALLAKPAISALHAWLTPRAARPVTELLSRDFPSVARATVVASPSSRQAFEIAVANEFVDYLRDSWPARAKKAPQGLADWSACLEELLQAGTDPSSNVWAALCASPVGRAAVLSADGSMRTRLRDAAAASGIATVKWATSLLDRADPAGMTPLHAAAHQGNQERVEHMLKCGSKADVRDRAWRTPLMLASAAGNAGIVEMIAAECDINATDLQGFTAMHHACSNGHVDALEKLVENSASLSICDHIGRYPLAVAAVAGHVEAVKWICVNSKKHATASDTIGWTAMHFVVSDVVCGGDKANVDKMLETITAAISTGTNGRDALMSKSKGKTPSPQQILDGTAGQYYHPYMIARALREDDVVALKLAMPRDAMWNVQRGWTVWLQAVLSGAEECMADIWDDLEVLHDRPSDDDLFSVHVAVLAKQHGVLSMLLKNSEGVLDREVIVSALALANKFRDIEAAEMLQAAVATR